MEDSHIIDLEVNDKNIALFGVFDGHGGFEVSKFVERHFINSLK